jgi:hypothetical protein
MPPEITDEPSTEWRCTGHVVRVEAVDSAQGKLEWACSLIVMKFRGWGCQ